MDTTRGIKLNISGENMTFPVWYVSYLSFYFISSAEDRT